MIVRWIDNAINKMNCHDFRRLYNATKSDNSIRYLGASHLWDLIWLFTIISHGCAEERGTHKTLHRNAEKKYINHFPSASGGKVQGGIYGICYMVYGIWYVTQSQSMTMINTFSTLGPNSVCGSHPSMDHKIQQIVYNAHGTHKENCFYLVSAATKTNLRSQNARGEKQGFNVRHGPADNERTDRRTDRRTDSRADREADLDLEWDSNYNSKSKLGQVRERKSGKRNRHKQKAFR